VWSTLAYYNTWIGLWIRFRILDWILDFGLDSGFWTGSDRVRPPAARVRYRIQPQFIKVYNMSNIQQTYTFRNMYYTSLTQIESTSQQPATCSRDQEILHTLSDAHMYACTGTRTHSHTHYYIHTCFDNILMFCHFHQTHFERG
jgi:hypothetical protein